MITLLDCLILAGLYCIFFYQRYSRLTARQFLTESLFYVYVCVVVYFTLLPIVPTFDAPTYNLVPFRDFIYSFGDYEKQILYNILLFVPMGFFLPSIRNLSLKKTVMIGFCISLAIEILQPWITLGRVCDVTDLITNTFGTLVGYGIYSLIHRNASKKPL